MAATYLLEIAAEAKVATGRRLERIPYTCSDAYMETRMKLEDLINELTDRLFALMEGKDRSKRGIRRSMTWKAKARARARARAREPPDEPSPSISALASAMASVSELPVVDVKPQLVENRPTEEAKNDLSALMKQIQLLQEKMDVMAQPASLPLPPPPPPPPTTNTMLDVPLDVPAAPQLPVSPPPPPPPPAPPLIAASLPPAAPPIPNHPYIPEASPLLADPATAKRTLRHHSSPPKPKLEEQQNPLADITAALANLSNNGMRTINEEGSDDDDNDGITLVHGKRVYTRKLAEGLSFADEVKLSALVKLRKTGIPHSPGGTPLRTSRAPQRNMLEQALFKKFKNMNSPADKHAARRRSMRHKRTPSKSLSGEWNNGSGESFHDMLATKENHPTKAAVVVAATN